MLLGRSKPKSFMVPCSCVSWELEKSPGFGWWAGGLLGRKKSEIFGSEIFGRQECSLEKPWGQDCDVYPFLCLFARRCLPQMGRRIWSKKEELPENEQRIWLKRCAWKMILFMGFLAYFQGLSLASFTDSANDQPWNFGGLRIEKDKQSLDFSLGFFEGKSCSKRRQKLWL